jgi:hypothetical protein
MKPQLPALDEHFHQGIRLLGSKPRSLEAAFEKNQPDDLRKKKNFQNKQRLATHF